MGYAPIAEIGDVVISINNTIIFEGNLTPIGGTQSVMGDMITNVEGTGALEISYGYYQYWRRLPEYNTYPIFQDLRDHMSVELSSSFFGHLMGTIGNTLKIYNKKIGDQYAITLRTTSVDSSRIYAKAGVIAGGRSVESSNTISIYGFTTNPYYGIYIGFLVDSENKWCAPYFYQQVEHMPLQDMDQAKLYNWIQWTRNDFNYYRNIYYLIVSGEVIPIPEGDPYAGGGYSDVGGGDPDEQNFDETSDVISEPALPIFSATGSGMVTAYVPTIGEINSIADYLIDPNIIQALAGTVLKLSDVILGINIFPFQVPAANSKEVKLNLMGAHLSTGVTSHYADNQFVTMDMGSIQIEKCWDNCLDYNPYTRITIFLPFCGYYELDTDEVMGKTVNVKYKIDVMTGSCVALVIVDGSVLYQFAGQCASQIPVSSVSFDGMISSMIDLGLSFGAAQASVGGAAAAAESAEEAFMNAKGAENIIATGDRMLAAKENVVNVKGAAGRQLMGATASAILSSKGFYTHAGGLSSAPGFLGVRKPFIIKKIPKQSVPEGYGKMRGYPSNIKSKLSDLSGYTEVEEIQLNIPNATVAEIAECERILKAGCYL